MLRLGFVAALTIIEDGVMRNCWKNKIAPCPSFAAVTFATQAGHFSRVFCASKRMRSETNDRIKRLFTFVNWFVVPKRGLTYVGVVYGHAQVAFR